jgi:hypothetical protein
MYYTNHNLGGTRDSESSRVREPGNFFSRISARISRIWICLAAESISRSIHRIMLTFQESASSRTQDSRSADSSFALRISLSDMYE